MQVANSEFYTTKELAMRCGVSPRTVEGWRSNGLGPKHLYVGARVMYKVSDVELWLLTSYERAEQYRAERYKARYNEKGIAR